jgi:hypothetical protein
MASTHEDPISVTTTTCSSTLNIEGIEDGDNCSGAVTTGGNDGAADDSEPNHVGGDTAVAKTDLADISQNSAVGPEGSVASIKRSLTDEGAAQETAPVLVPKPPEKKRKRVTLTQKQKKTGATAATNTASTSTCSSPKEEPPKVDGRRKNKGASKRASYSVAFKAKMVRDYDDWEAAQKDANKSASVREYVTLKKLGQKFEKFLR